MRTLILISGLVLLGSCRVIKQDTVHHESVKDSTIVRHEVIVDTFKVKQDVFSDSINLNLLKQLGQVTYRGDRTTTRIFYRDGNIGFHTESDSLFKLLLNRIESTEKYRDHTKIITKTKKVKSNWWIPFSIGIALVVIILISIRYVRKRFLN